MNDTGHDTRTQNRHQANRYRITVAGYLDTSWATWFEGMTLRHTGEGTTEIEGPIVDQPALYGMLKRIHNLGVTLISVNPC